METEWLYTYTILYSILYSIMRLPMEYNLSPKADGLRVHSFVVFLPDGPSLAPHPSQEFLESRLRSHPGH